MNRDRDATTRSADAGSLDDFLIPGAAWRSPLVQRLISDTERSVLPPGTRVGPFRIGDVLGSGGMATVYAAERVDGDFTQRVALKVAPARGGAEAEVLFRRERRMLAALEHPGIARMIDGGVSADGLQWLAMERIDGERVDAHVARLRPAARTCVALVRQAAAALAYAHSQLAVHRDIKPSNVMVDARGHVKLLDFGIAALLADELAGDPGRQALTPRYASPEQRRGEPCSVASDVYQLGFLLAELLAIAAGRRIDDGIPKPADADLAAIVARATATEAAQRYGTAAAFIDDLDRWSDGRPVAARGGGALYRARRFAGRHRWPLAVATIAAFVLAVFAWVSVAEIESARRTAEREAAKAREVSRFLASVFNAASPYVSRGRSPTLSEVLDSGVERLAKELADQPDVRGELSMVIGRVYMTLNQPDRARALLADAVTLGRTDSSLDPVQRAQRLRLYGVALQAAHRRAEATAAYEEARALLAATPGEAALRELSGLMRNFALLRYQSGDIAGGIALQREALALAIARLGEADTNVARARANLGQFVHNYGEYAEGTALVARGLETLRAALGPDHPETIAIGGAYGGMLIENGDLAAGAPLLEASIEAGFANTPRESPWYPLQLGYRAWLRMQQGRYDEAISDAEAALEIADRLPPADDHNSVAVLETLGETHLRRGDAAAAISVLERMLERNREGRHAIRVDLGHRPLLLARAYAAAGRCDDARAWLARADALIAERTVPGHRLRHEADALRSQCT